ncbi:MAG: SH3 domain-containing protein [Terriglobia bacterium]
MALMLGIVIGVVCYHFLFKPEKSHPPAEIAYVLPQTLPVLNTTAIIHTVIATLHAGQQVEVTERIGDWAHLALSDGRDGWVEQQNLLDAKTYAQSKELLKRVETMQVQAVGHADAEVNLHLTPSRSAPVLAELSPRQPLEVCGRRLVNRPAQPGSQPAATVQDVWYLVRGGGRAGWMLGRFVDLDVPPGLAPYAEGVNMVAWLVLDSVNDGGHQEPQYLAADRIGTREFDFNHIRVFTWWIKRHKYVTAYVESGLDGYFPITVTHDGSVPYFRLRLVDDTGHKYQKVYGLFDTIVRPAGTVDGWNSDAMPQPRHSRRRRTSLRRRAPAEISGTTNP